MASGIGLVDGAPRTSVGARFAWLDQLRAVAMYLVIVGHAVAPYTRLDTFIYAFHMPLFFIISGMTFRPDRYATVFACAIDKAKKLLVPYALLSLATIPWWYLNWRVLDHSSERFRDLLDGIAISNQSIANSPANAMWYLPALFLLSILFTALWKLASGKSGRFAVLVACCGLAGIALSLKYRQPVAWHLPTVLTASIFYYAGYLFMAHREKVTKRIAERPVLLATLIVALFGVGTAVAMYNGKVSMHGNHYNSVLLFLLAAFALSAAVILGVSKLPTFKWLAYLGQNTLVTLAVHVPMLRTIQHISPAGLHFTYAHPLITGALVFVATIPFTMFVNRFVPFLVAKRYPKTLQPATVGEAG